MSRASLLEQLRNRGLDHAESLIADLEPQAIEGAIRWYDGKMRLGEKIGPGLLADKLKRGGCPGFQSFKPRTGAFDGHLAWCRRHVPELSPSLAGGAYDVLRVLLRREPTADQVRRAVVANEERGA